MCLEPFTNCQNWAIQRGYFSQEDVNLVGQWYEPHDGEGVWQGFEIVSYGLTAGEVVYALKDGTDIWRIVNHFLIEESAKEMVFPDPEDPDR